MKRENIKKFFLKNNSQLNIMITEAAGWSIGRDRRPRAAYSVAGKEGQRRHDLFWEGMEGSSPYWLL